MLPVKQHRQYFSLKHFLKLIEVFQIQRFDEPHCEPGASSQCLSMCFAITQVFLGETVQ